MRRLAIILVTAAFIWALAVPSVQAAEGAKVFRTRYATVHYAVDKDLDDFIWKLGGIRTDLPGYSTMASNRIDRIIDRIQTILDMRPRGFHLEVYLYRDMPAKDKIAYYDPKTKTIHLSAAHVTDGVFAHEVTHAVINAYFSPAPSSKVQEILTQYVDVYLWSDY